MPNRDEDKLPDILRTLREQGDGLTSPGEAYFSNMAAKAIGKGKEPASVRPVAIRWVAVAASVLVLLTIGWWMSGASGEAEIPFAEQTVEMSSDELLAEINVEAIDAYVSEQIDEFTLELYEEVPIKD